MNVLTLVGNIVRDAELRVTHSNKDVLTFTIPAKSGYGEHEKVTWVRCTLWGARAKALAQYLKKGQSVSVSGEMSTSEYTAKDGEKRTTVELHVNQITLCGSRNNTNDSANQPLPQQAEDTQQASNEDDCPF